jgi:hypothetical protein
LLQVREDAVHLLGDIDGRPLDHRVAGLAPLPH